MSGVYADDGSMRVTLVSGDGVSLGSIQFGVVDSTGNIIFPDSMSQTAATYNTDNLPLTITISDGTNTWVKTFTWDTNGNSITKSKWVKQ